MYLVSDSFRAALLKPVINCRLTGTIGSVSFTENNIVRGSFRITNQCTNSNDVTLGLCNIGQLEGTFTGVSLSYFAWLNKKISVSVGIEVAANTWEDVPLGIFKIKEAKHTAEGVAVVAYDNMIKFDKKIKKSHFKNPASMYEHLDQICDDCHVTLGMTENQINAMVTGSGDYTVYGYQSKEMSNDIETYRDLLYWIAQAMGCFATINRSGELVLRMYSNTAPVDTISDSYRLSGAQFNDTITAFTGVYFEDLDTGDVHYYGKSVDGMQSEKTALNGVITQAEADIAVLDQQLADGDITQEQYNTAVAPLNRAIRQATKKINKLNDEIEQAQNDDAEGTDMDCGANPLLMNSNESTRTTQRTNVLNALENANFTPFQSSTIFGVHYDLGDCIYCTGGHAGSGQYVCVMAYDWTYNAEYSMQGFGSEDAQVKCVIKSKSEKAAKSATGSAATAKAIADSKPDITVSGNPPSGGKTGDMHVQTGTAIHKTPKYEVVWENEERTLYQWFDNVVFPPRDDVFSPTAIVWDEATSSYNMEFYGSVSYHKIDNNNYCSGGIPILRIKNFPHTDGVHHFRMRVESVSYEIIGNNTEADWQRYADHLGLQVRRYQETNPTGFPDPGQVITDTIHFDLGGGGGPYQTDGEISGDGADPNNDYSVKLFVVDTRMINEDDWDAINFGRLTITGFKFEIYTDYEQRVTDGGYTETDEPYVGQVSVKDPDGNWRDINRIADIETPTDPEKQEETGLQVTQDTRILSLRKNVMRAAVKSGPPGKSNKPGHNQFRIRYTGKPDSDADITYYGGHGWTVNGRIKHDENNVYKFSAKGTNVSGDVNYCAFKIENLTANKKYHFNFAAKWNSGTTFGKDYTKGCGVVFNNTGVINTNDWTGNPDTFNENTGYCSFMRNTSKRYYECDFTATASTMYMVLTTADITSTDEHSITFYDFVIGTTARSYMRELYMYDYVTNTWMKYMPFSAVTGGGEEPSGEGSVVTVTPVDPATLNNPIKIADMTVDGDAYAIYAPNGSVINSLDDIGDVEITSPTTGQTLKYNATTQKWENGTDTGGADAVEITWAAYQALTPAQKADATKVYYVTDYPGGGGGGDSTVRYDENTRYIQVLDHGHWINAYKVPVEYFINKYFTTENPVNETYTFTEDGKYLVWANTCVNEGSPTSKISTTATVLSQNSESGTDSGYYRVCEYMIVDAVVGDTVTIAASSYDRNSVGVIQLVNGITLTEYAFEFEVDGTASLSKTYEVNDRYLVLLLTSGAQRSISGNGNMEQSWSDDENSIDFIERNADTVSYSAYGYAGGAGVIIVFTVS